MAYVGILLITILVSFVIVRIGGLALELTGIEPDVARFQALSAFSGTGFTTREAERVVGHRARRRIVTVLIVLGNAGLVTVIAMLVASFTQVTGYMWFLVRLAIIIGGIIGLYQLIIRSRVGHRILNWVRRPLVNRIIREVPTVEEIFNVGKDWGISLITAKERTKGIGLSVANITAEGNIEILSIERADASITKPDKQEKIIEGDRLLVYGHNKSVRQLLS
jgi:hypothetical protein